MDLDLNDDNSHQSDSDLTRMELDSDYRVASDNKDLEAANGFRSNVDMDSSDEWSPDVSLHPIVDYFAHSAKPPRAFPTRTFVSRPVAFHLGFDPAVCSMEINTIADKYGLPDLHAALVHYVYRNHNGRPLQVGGKRQHPADERLPFQQLQIWQKFHLQQRAYHDPTHILPAQSLIASPPSLATGWPKGWYDTAFINIDDNAVWPSSGLKGNSAYSSTAILLIWTIFTGHIVCKIQLIFWPVPLRGLEGTWWSNQFLLYVARLDNVLVHNMDFDEVTGMHILKRVQRASGMPISDVVPLSQV